MNDVVTALFLGFIEGLTEFLPVSSTGHLLVLTDMLHFSAPAGHVFEIFIQLGAILAVVVLYFQKFWHTALYCFREDTSRRFALNLVVGTVPALIFGALGRDWIKTHLYNMPVIAVALIVGGLVILLLEKRLTKNTVTSVDEISLKKAFLIGCAQSLALMPGVSRSGATIMGSLGLGLSRSVAAEFSFFLAVPVMCAAVAYDTFKARDAIMAGGYWGIMGAGFVAAFLTALLVMKLALKIIGRFGFAPFAFYRIAAGLFILVFLL